jgi:hypothetical protein
MSRVRTCRVATEIPAPVIRSKFVKLLATEANRCGELIRRTPLCREQLSNIFLQFPLEHVLSNLLSITLPRCLCVSRMVDLREMHRGCPCHWAFVLAPLMPFPCGLHVAHGNFPPQR